MATILILMKEKSLNPEVLRFISDEPPISTVENSGFTNTNFVVEYLSRKIVVKNLKAYEPPLVEEEGIYRDFLSKHSPLVSPFHKFDDKYVLTVGKENYVVNDYVEGVNFGDSDNQPIEKVAEFMAITHMLPYENLPEHDVWFSKEFMIDTVKRIKTFKPGFSLDLQKMISKFKNFWDEDLPRGIVHGDLHGDNCIVENGELVAVLDWEECGVFPLVLDLGRTINTLLRTDSTFDDVKFLKFIQSYESIRPLSTLEKETLQDAVNYSFLLTAMWIELRIISGQIAFEDVAQWKDNYKRRIALPKF